MDFGMRRSMRGCLLVSALGASAAILWAFLPPSNRTCREDCVQHFTFRRHADVPAWSAAGVAFTASSVSMDPLMHLTPGNSCHFRSVDRPCNRRAFSPAAVRLPPYRGPDLIRMAAAWFWEGTSFHMRAHSPRQPSFLFRITAMNSIGLSVEVFGRHVFWPDNPHCLGLPYDALL